MLSAARKERVFVSIVVLLETVWVLSARYKQEKKTILNFLKLLSQSQGIVFDNAELVKKALDDWEKGPAGFADYLIVNQADMKDCRTTYTFETKKLARDPRVTVLTSNA